MGKLLTAAVIVIILLVAGDVAARVYTEHQLEQRINRSVAGAEAKVKISGFPFVGKLAAQGRADRITAHLVHAGEGAFVLDRVDIAVIGATVDRGQFLQHRRLVIDRIDTGTVVADMSQADFDRLVGVPVTFDDGAAHATIAGVKVTARVSIVNNRLLVSAIGLPGSIPVPAIPVLPCSADVKIVPGHLIASCTFHQIPPAFQVISP